MAPVIKQILVPVPDLAQAIEFFSMHLRFPVKFVDPPRYAALDAGSITIGLVAGEENITDNKLSMSIVVDDVDETVARLRENGAVVLADSKDGPHERRAVVEVIGDHPIVLHTKNKR